MQTNRRLRNVDDQKSSEYSSRPLVFHTLLTLEEAREKLLHALGGANPLGTEKIPSKDTVGIRFGRLEEESRKCLYGFFGRLSID